MIGNRLSRRMIHHWIETGQLDRDLDNEAVRYKKRPSTPRKIDPYCGIIHSCLAPVLAAIVLGCDEAAVPTQKRSGCSGCGNGRNLGQRGRHFKERVVARSREESTGA